MKVWIRIEYLGRNRYVIRVADNTGVRETLSATRATAARTRNRLCARYAQLAVEVEADAIPEAWDMAPRQAARGKDEMRNEARVARPQARAAARLMAFARWKGTTPEERSELMSAAGKQGGRPRSGERCFCGKFTMLRAASRKFDCCRKAGKITVAGLRRDAFQPTLGKS